MQQGMPRGNPQHKRLAGNKPDNRVLGRCLVKPAGMVAYGSMKVVMYRPLTTKTLRWALGSIGMLAMAGGAVAWPGLLSPYAHSAWPAPHAEGRNATAVGFALPTHLAMGWRVLEDHTFYQGVTIGPAGQLYAATGKGVGFASLHALRADGTLLWESAPYQGPDDLDSGAVFSAPTIDRYGDLYLTDSNQFWALHGDGRIKWVEPLPAGALPALAVQFIGGAVVAVTGDGQVIARARADGRLLAPVLRLPDVAVVSGDHAPNSQLPPLDGRIDPALRQDFVDVLFGYSWPVTNTPAVHPLLPRLYIPARTATGSRLYALDLHATPGRKMPARWKVVFATSLAGQGAASPALSPDGRWVYCAEHGDTLAAMDAGTGRRLWAQPLGANLLAAPTVAHDGTIFVNAGAIVAMTPQGTVRWRQDFSAFAPLVTDIRVPVATGRGNSVITAAPNVLYVVVGFRAAPYFFILDPGNGAILDEPIRLVASSETIIAASSSGAAYVTHMGLLTTGPKGGGITALLPATERP